MNNINLERLQTLATASRSSTFAEAARIRRVSVSAISQQLSALEAQLGIELFERVGRRVRLTTEGRALAQAVSAHLDGIEDAIEATTHRRNSVAGWVTVGTPRSFGQVYLAPRLPLLLSQFRDLRVRLRFDIASVLERELLDGGLDLALLTRPPEVPGLEIRAVARETFVAVRRRTRPPKNEPSPMSEKAARSLRWLTFSSDRPMHDAWWRSAFGKASSPMVEACAEIPSLELLLALVERGAGVAVLPDYLIHHSLERGAIEPLPVSTRKPAHSTLFLAWRQGVVVTARFDAVRQALDGEPGLLNSKT